LGKKTRQTNAKNIKNSHCQCKKYKKFALPMQIGEKTCQTNAKNIINLDCQSKFGKKTCQINARNRDWPYFCTMWSLLACSPTT
jgi:hypothetical protein